MERRWWLLIGVLSLAVGLSYWFATSVDRPEADRPGLPREADAFMASFEALQVDVAGRPRQRLRAAYLEHFPGDDSTELKQPRLILYRDIGPPVEVRADRARVSAHGDLIRLYGRVVVRRTAAPGVESVEVRTEQLLVRPEDEFAQTDVAVEIETAAGITSGVGMRAYLQDQLYQLLSRVRGRYEAKSIPTP